MSDRPIRKMKSNVNLCVHVKALSWLAAGAISWIFPAGVLKNAHGASESERTPDVFVEINGQKREILKIDTELENGRRLIVSSNENGDNVYSKDNARIGLDFSQSIIEKYLFFSTNYFVECIDPPRSKLKSDLFGLRIRSLDEQLNIAWPESDTRLDTYGVCWYDDGSVEFLGFIPQKRGPDFLVLTDKLRYGENGLAGVPALIAFEGRDLRSVSDGFERTDLVSIYPNSDLIDWNSLNGHLPLAIAAQSGNVDFLDFTFTRSQRNRFDDAFDEFTQDLLARAHCNGRTTASEFIVRKGADPYRSHSPLRVEFTNLPILMELPILNREPIWWLVHRGHAHTLDRYLRKPKWRHLSDLLVDAIGARNGEVFDLLKSRGVGLGRYKKELDQGEYTRILRQLLSRGEWELSEIFVDKYEFGYELTDTDGTNALHWIAPFAEETRLEAMSRNGVDIDRQDEFGLTPLMVALSKSNIPAICWFVENGAKVEQKDAKGHTPLQYAIVRKKYDSAACLMSYGVSLNELGPFGVTPLMQSILFKENELAKSIVSNGGIWNFDSRYTDLCLEIALQMDFVSAIESALEQGMKRDRKIHGKWPMEWLSSYMESNRVSELLGKSDFQVLEELSPEENDLEVKGFNPDSANEVFTILDLPSVIKFQCVIKPGGNVSLPVLHTDFDRNTENVIRRLIASIQVSINAKDEVSSWYRAECELVTNDFRLKFPRDIRAMRLSRIKPPSS